MYRYPLLATFRGFTVRSLPGLETGRHMSTSVLIIDDSLIMRKALRTLLGTTSQWHVCGEADNGKTGVAMVKELHPDVVILDFEMPIMNGLEAAKLIAADYPQTPILIVTSHDTCTMNISASSAGVRRVNSKSEFFTQTVLSSIAEVA
jgi:DNA-binding NarL/FixJ family response regulator